MVCQHQMTQYALVSMSGLDMEDVWFGQFLTLLVGVSIVVLVWSIYLFCQ